MKIHVTGASGFIGRALCPALVAAGHELAPASDAAAVVHLAGIAHRTATRDEYRKVNVELALERAREAAARGARFVFMSSVKVHGELSAAPLRPESPLAPQDGYAESKARAEDGLRAIAGLRLTILRPPLVYGPGVKANFLALVRAIANGWPLPLASVENRRSLLYVGNLAASVLACLDRDGTYLVCDAGSVGTPALCREIGRALGRPARLFAWPSALLPKKLAGSLEIDESRLPCAPAFTREQGLRATAHWYLHR